MRITICVFWQCLQNAGLAASYINITANWFTIVVYTEAAVPEVHYATVEMFANRAMRVTGQVGSVLTAQLTSTTAKTHKDDRGW